MTIDTSPYIAASIAAGLITVAGRYIIEAVWAQVEALFMCVANVPVNDETYNMVMAWTTTQEFARNSRRFVVNTNLTSRNWHIWQPSGHGRDSTPEEDSDESTQSGHANRDKLQYTPSFGTHYFWHRGRLFFFTRKQVLQHSSVPLSEREEISISTFGRDPSVLRELLEECRADFVKNDEARTVIYRSSCDVATKAPVWRRCMSRKSRPFSTIFLAASVKEALVSDAMDYLHPVSRRWYSDHGIPYRRGYLFHGPPGTGKTSFGLAIAGLLKLNVYIVSLKSPMMNDETLEIFFATLPSRCVVLLEDIDIAGLTHSRLACDKTGHENGGVTGRQVVHVDVNSGTAGVSLPALLNVMDGAASQEGRMIIMTTNHVEKLDKALIRPGRIDKAVKFDLADASMVSSLFDSLFARGDTDPVAHTVTRDAVEDGNNHSSKNDASTAVEALTQAQAGDATTSAFAHRFAQAIPSGFFSIAEIQGYLLHYKNDPSSALENAEDWVKTISGQRLESKLPLDCSCYERFTAKQR